MAKTNWQDPGSSEILSSHISGLQEAVGKIETSLNLPTVTETGMPLTEVFISNDDRYRIFQAPLNKRNWVVSPAPVIKKNGTIINDDFIIDFGGGAVIFTNPITENDILTADATYTTNINGMGLSTEDFTTENKEDLIYVHDNIEVTKSPIGFPNRTDSTFSFNSSTRIFTIEPTGTSYDVFFKDNKYTKTAAASIEIPLITGLHYIFFDEYGTLSTSMTFPGLQNMIYVSYIYCNADTGQFFCMGDERHGTVMDKATHERLHSVDWTQWVSGLQIYDYELDNPNGDNAVKVSIGNGYVADEDLKHHIQHSPAPTIFFEQILQDYAHLPVMHRNGENGEWNQDTATEFPFKNTLSGRVNFNEYDGTEWKQTEALSGAFVAYYVIFAGDVKEPIKVVQGQRYDSTLEEALANNDDRNILWGNQPFEEFKVLYRLIYQTSDSYTNARKAQLVDVLDLRAARRSPGGGGIVPSAHSNLTGLEYDSSGHIGFASSEDLEDKLDKSEIETIITETLPSSYESTYDIPETAKRGKLDVGLKGMSNANLLGTDGNCEDISKFKTGYGTPTLTLDTGNKVYGSTALKMVTTVNGHGTGLSFMAQANKYYMLSMYYKTETGELKYAINDVSNSVNLSPEIPIPSSANMARMVTKLATTANSLDVRFLWKQLGATAMTAYIDGVMINEISEDEYNNISVDELMAKYPYHDGLQGSTNIQALSTGKNIADLDINKAYRRVGYAEPYVSLKNSMLTISGSSSGGRFIAFNYRVKKGQQYIITFDANNATVGCKFYNTKPTYWDGFGSPSYINTGAIVVASEEWLQIYFEVNTGQIGTVSNLQLEEGATATAYEPYKGTEVFYKTLDGQPITLHRLLNGVYDEKLVDGRCIKRTGEKVLVASDIINSSGASPNTVYYTRSFSDLSAKAVANTIDDAVLIDGWKEILQSDATLASSNGSFYAYNGVFYFVVTSNTYPNLASAQQALAGTKIIYELAQPLILETNATPLIAEPNGHVFITYDGPMPENEISYPLNLGAVVDGLIEGQKELGNYIGGLNDLIGLGGVVESGSNTNGRYVKFSDGTLICTTTKDINFTQISTTIPLPHSFTENAAVSYGINTGGTGATTIANRSQCYARSTTTNLVFYSSGAETATLPVSFLAIGRWK